MRTSKRTAILDTIVEIIETNGFSEVTYENVATQCGMSKSGLIYHFPSREDMIRSVHEHMAQLWEEELIEAAGGPAEEVSPRQPPTRKPPGLTGYGNEGRATHVHRLCRRPGAARDLDAPFAPVESAGRTDCHR